MIRRQNLKLSNLYLDLYNPRFEKQESQSEALNTMALEQREKLLVLLRDIIENGLNPSDIPIVMLNPQKDNSYIVLEGNRRIAALKLLKKPAILTNARLKTKYSRLHDKYKNRIIKSIDCLIVDSRNEANIWIERKHEGEMNGAGTVRWDNVQKSRFLSSKFGKGSKVLQLIDFIKTVLGDDTELSTQIQKISATNLERLISTPDVRIYLGLDYVNGVFYSRLVADEVLKGLKAIVSRLSLDGFNVRSIYHKEDRVNFIHSIPEEELPNKTKREKYSWALQDYKPTKTQHSISELKTGLETRVEGAIDPAYLSSENPVQSRPITRNSFIPEELVLSISNDRINRLFTELKQLSHNEFPNVCSVLMRVFIELSIDSYLEVYNLLREGVVSGAKDPRDLKQKANTVIQSLESKNFLDESLAKGIRTEFNSNQSIFSIDTLNAYVHNGSFNPIPNSIMLSWDNAQPFVVALWKAINDKKK